MLLLIAAELDWNATAAIATAASVFVAIAAWWVASQTVKETRLYNTMNLATTLSQRFDEMKTERKIFATTILSELSKDSPNVETIIPTSCPVLEFFEDLGYLTRRGLVDHGIVWTHFFWVIERYHIALTSLSPTNFNCIERLRELEGNDPLLYQEFEYLFTTLQKHGIKEQTNALKRRGQCMSSVSYKAPANDRVRVFLQGVKGVILLFLAEEYKSIGEKASFYFSGREKGSFYFFWRLYFSRPSLGPHR